MVPDIRVNVFVPQKEVDIPLLISPAEKPKMTARRAYVLRILSQYGILGYELTLLEVHKLLYFFQEAGEPLRLRFSKHIYGPYADNLRHLLLKFEGHFTKGFPLGSEKPDVKIEILPQAIEEAELLLEKNKESHDESARRMQRVSELIEGFESPYGLELLSSVHWIYCKENKNNEIQIIDGLHSWNSRKRKILKTDHIRLAIERLNQQNWIQI
jgi:hypothetical protein